MTTATSSAPAPIETLSSQQHEGAAAGVDRDQIYQWYSLFNLGSVRGFFLICTQLRNFFRELGSCNLNLPNC